MAFMQELASCATSHAYNPFGVFLESTCVCAGPGRWHTSRIYQERDYLLTPGRPFLGCTRCHWVVGSCARAVPSTAGNPFADRKMLMEELWRKFFSDPSEWWDHRLEKVNPRYPDFKHKQTRQSLWLIDKSTPLWVEAELSALPLETLQSSIFSWNKRLERYVSTGHFKKALELFKQILRDGINPNGFTFVLVLKACSGLRALGEGRCIHLQIIQKDLESDGYVASCLVNMYSKCGNTEEARRVFNRMPTRNVVAWNAMIGGYVKHGEGQKALDLFCQMQEERVDPNSVTFTGLLNACASLGALGEGRCLHGQIIQRGYESDVFVGSSLLDMYAKCGSIEDAQRVFNEMSTRDVVSWSAMIVGYVKCGEGQKAVELFREMKREGVNPNSVTFVGVLSACTSMRALEEGRRFHKEIIERGLELGVHVASCLVDMYAKCLSIEDAKRVFNKMPIRNVVSWNAMITGYVKCGLAQNALELFRQMEVEEVDPDKVTFLGVLSACASLRALGEGRDVHELIIDRGYESDNHVTSCLVDMYAKCGSIGNAWEIFNKMPTKDVVSWNAMILGYVKCGEGKKALVLFQEMQVEGWVPDVPTFVAALNACASLTALEDGRHIHELVIEKDLESDVFVGSALVDMYAKCGSIDSAGRVFDKMSTRVTVSWNAMIMGYVNCGEWHHALEYFRQMQKEGVDPSPITFVGVLTACASIQSLEEGMHYHQEIIARNYESDVFVSNSLINMYAKCGSIDDAENVFNKLSTCDVVAWNAMILGYVKCAKGAKALDLYRQMDCKGVDPDPVTFVGVLNACASVVDLEEGCRVHEQIILRGYESDPFLGSSLVDMYAKCGSIKNARSVFNNMSTRCVVAWSAMIMGYANCGEGQVALDLFREMQREGVDPNSVTFVGLVSACASVAVFEEGKRVHGQIIERGYESNAIVASSLIDMYGKCGSIEDAWEVFRKMPLHDVISWNTMLAAYARHGYSDKALEHFKRMCEKVNVNGATFVSLLSACSHGGLVDEGLHFFESMSAVYNVCPMVDHYACLVDLLGRANCLHEAEDLIRNMPWAEDATVWMTLLGACRLHGNVDIGERVAKKLLEADPGNVSVYTLLSNIYAAAE